MKKIFKIFEKLEEFLIVNDAAIRIVIIIFLFFCLIFLLFFLNH